MIRRRRSAARVELSSPLRARRHPDTGELQCGFQAVPHYTHDWDAAEVPVLVDADFRGTPRKLLLQASRNGYYFVLDRTTGQNLLRVPFATVNAARRRRRDRRADHRYRRDLYR